MKQSVLDLQVLINQSGNDIEEDGIFGSQTSGAIDDLDIPYWIKVAMKEVGVTEISGKNHNSRIMDYHRVSGGFSSDEVPWCGSFVNWVMKKSGETKTVSIPARAKSWLNFGRSSREPVLGSIAVKSRKGGGHVCFVVGKNSSGDLYCLGGNQNNEVNIKLYPKDVFIDFRVPEDVYIGSLPKYALGNSKTSSEA